MTVPDGAAGAARPLRAALVAPYFAENTLRYVRALADLPGVVPAVLTQDDPARLPQDLRRRVAVERVPDALDGEALAAGARALAARVGPLDRLLGVLEQLQVPLGHARDATGIPGMTEAVARNFREKDRMKEVLARAGVPCARHRLVSTAEDARAFAAQVGFPLVAKPPSGVGARGTSRLSDRAGLEALLSTSPPGPAAPWQLEEFVAGEENTFEGVTVRGRPVWDSGTRYLPGPLDVIENPWIQYCVLLPRETDDADFARFRPFHAAALRALGLDTGLTHMEWFRRADGSSLVSEVGARPPGVQIMPLMSLAHEVDMVAAWVRLMVLEEFDPPRRTRAAGCAFFRSQGRGDRIAAVRGVAEAGRDVGPLLVEARLPRVGQPVATGYEGEGWALVRHEDTEVVRRALLRLVTLVRIERG